MSEGRAIELDRYVEIGEVQYQVTLFAPTKALKLLSRITKLLGEPMAVMAAADGQGAKALDLLPKAVSALCERMDDEEEVIGLVKALLACASREKKAIDFETEFRGRLGDMMKLLSKVVEIQFQDFYAALGESLQGAKE